MKLAEKELANGVMVNVTGWGAVKVSSQRIDSLSERCGKQMVLSNSEFSRSLERDSKISREQSEISCYLVCISCRKSEPLHSIGTFDVAIRDRKKSIFAMILNRVASV